MNDRSRENVPEEEHNLPLTGLQLNGWGVILLQQWRPWTWGVLGHPATYSVDRDLWLNHRVTPGWEGEMGGGSRALCHVQARTGCLVFHRLGAESIETMTGQEGKRSMCFTSIGLRENYWEAERIRRFPISLLKLKPFSLLKKRRILYCVHNREPECQGICKTVVWSSID